MSPCLSPSHQLARHRHRHFERQVHPRLAGPTLPAGQPEPSWGRLRERTQLREFTIGQRPAQIVESLLALNPQIIGLAIYICNVTGPIRLAWRSAAT